MAVNLEKCCLCSSDVSRGTSKTKRRKLHGDACKVALHILDSVAVRHYGRNFSNLVHANPQCQDSYLCHKCKAKAEAFQALLSKVTYAEGDIINIIGNVVRSGRKRTFDDAADGAPTPLQPEKSIRQEGSDTSSGETVESLASNNAENFDTSAVSVCFGVGQLYTCSL
uniref:ZAD domain-containing protein n=1 Tax=Amphimedon queenslandica TaxID=400682 RepID=A0A1X7SEK7_AMPQE